MKTRRNLFLTSLLTLALTQASHAASANWTGLGADSNWTTTGNWSASPVPGAGDVATFNGAGNSKTTITTAPASLTRYVFDTSSAAAYTISAASTTWSVPNGGGVTINSGVVNDQDLSGIQFIRPASGSTTNFINNATGTTLKLGTMFHNNQASPATANALLSFAPATGATIEVITGKTLDNSVTAGRTVSVLVNGPGIFKMAGTGNFTGTDADGNSVTIRQGTLEASTINNADGARSSLGVNGRIQFGQASTTNTATLDYYTATNATTDRAFYIIDNNTAVFKVSGSASTNLSITSAITQSAATNGGGKLTKDGLGILTLSAANTYTGVTSVIGGTLTVATNGVINNANATTGTGFISGGATLRIDGGTAKFNTTGSTATGLLVGTTTAGNVVVTNNGTLNVNTGRLILGGSSAGSGTSTFTQDSGTTTVASSLFTGNFNDTDVNISGGSFTVGGDSRLSQRANTNFNISGTADVSFQDRLWLGGVVVGESYNSILNLDGGTLSVVDIANSNNGTSTFNFNGGTLKANASHADFLNADSVFVKAGGATIDTNAFDVTIDNALQQFEDTTGSLTKTGAGTLTLTASNSYTGATTVSAGTLIIDGNISTSSLTTVNENATIGGSGTVGAVTVLSGGFINPGNSSGKLNVAGNYIQAGLYTAEINGLTAGTEHDQIDVTGTVDITGGSLLTLFTGSYVENDLVFILLNDGTDAITGTFTGLAQGATVTSYGGFDWIISYSADSTSSSFTGGNDIALMAIPEPAAALLGGLGLLCLLRRRRA